MMFTMGMVMAEHHHGHVRDRVPWKGVKEADSFQDNVTEAPAPVTPGVPTANC